MDKAYDPQQHHTTIARPPQHASGVLVDSGLVAPAVLARHLNRPRYQPAFTVLALDDERPIGWLLLGHTRIQVGPATLDVGVIDDAFAPTADVMAALFGDALGTLHEQALGLVLAPGHLPGLADYGFAPFQYACRISGFTSEPTSMAAHALGSEDAESLAALYDTTYAALPGHEARTPADWRAWLAANPAARGFEDRSGRLLAYAVSEHGLLCEAAAADAGAACAVLALADAAVLALPFSHPISRVALQRGGRAVVNLPEAPASMLGVVDLLVLMEQLRPAFDERLARSRYAGWSGSIEIEIEGEQVALAFANGRATASGGPRPADVWLRRVRLVALAQLCVGFRSVSDLRAAGELDCDDAALGLLELLFPVLAA